MNLPFQRLGKTNVALISESPPRFNDRHLFSKRALSSQQWIIEYPIYYCYSPLFSQKSLFSLHLDPLIIKLIMRSHTKHLLNNYVQEEKEFYVNLNKQEIFSIAYHSKGRIDKNAGAAAIWKLDNHFHFDTTFTWVFIGDVWFNQPLLIVWENENHIILSLQVCHHAIPHDHLKDNILANTSGSI